jgi:hypothetical protein
MEFTSLVKPLAGIAALAGGEQAETAVAPRDSSVNGKVETK